MKNYLSINSLIPSFNKVLNIPGDKSLSIRWVLLASQAIGKSKAYNLLESEDVISAIISMRKLGVEILKRRGCYEINGVGLSGFRHKNNVSLDAGNSGTFARLLCGTLAGNITNVKVTGDSSLSKRDFSRVVKPLKLFGISIKTNKNKLPIVIKGSKFLRPIFYKEEKGSAQVKSAILLASLNTPGQTIVKSKISRDHTELMFKNCLKIPLKLKKYKNHEIIKVHGKTNYKGFNYNIPGDISSAAFFIALTVLANKSRLRMKNVNYNKSRIGIIEILKKMKAKIKITNIKNYKGEKVADISVTSSKNLIGINCPKSLNTRSIDEFLIIFLVCAKAKGISKFVGINELRQKESDRLKMAAKFLKSIGIKVDEKFDSLKIYGNPDLKIKKKVIIKNFLKDHRVFMMSCVAALTLGGNFKIYDKNSINSSFPNFLDLLKKLGANVDNTHLN
tara:strand:+ start:522 stop:1865 length:1344 start_codon:yes stop_codon:yes gene_type:complete